MAAISENVALRIALAAKALPEVEIKDLLSDLLALLGEPLTEAKLSRLRLGRIKQIPVAAEIEEVYLRNALAFLKGQNINTEPLPVPQPEPYEDGEMKDSVRVGCASNSGSRIDGHFGSCSRFLIYQISPGEKKLIAVRTAGKVPDDVDKNSYRASLIKDCQVVYTASIGGPAAAKVVRAGIHPIKLPTGGDADSVLNELQATLADNPPPWLAKIMGYDAEARVRFKEEDEDDRASAY